jgi:uncharacterized protein DUF397
MMNHFTIQWRKSSHSSAQGGECVEVAGLSGRIAVRDSKNPAGPILTFDTAAFGAFLDRVRQEPRSR